MLDECRILVESMFRSKIVIMNLKILASVSCVALVLVGCSGSSEPLKSPKTATPKEEVKKEAQKTVKKTTASKKPKPKPKSTPKKTSKPKTASDKPIVDIPVPAPILDKPVVPDVPKVPILKPVVEQPVVKPVIKKSIPTATSVLGRDGYVHNPYNFDEHIDVRNVSSGSVVTPQGDPDKQFRVP